MMGKFVKVSKAYLPTLDETRGVSLDDIQSLRWIPERHRKTFAQPISVSRSKKRGIGQTIPYEIGVTEKEHGIPLPGVLSQDKTGIDPRKDVTGTWVGPSNIGTLMEPDFTFDPRKERGTLLGITENPHWWRTMAQGAKSQAGEGFQYGGFPKESFVEIPRPDNASPFDIAGGAFHMLTGFQEPSPEMTDFLQQFPQEQGTHRWGRAMGSPLTEQQLIDQGLITPLSYEQRIVDSPFLPRKVASEPMDIAFQLLKASMYFGAGKNADPKGVRQASLEGHQFASQPAVQQAAQASDARVRNLTGGSQELGTMLSTNQWNPESAWGGQSEETPFRGINLSEYGRRLNLGQFGDDEETQERKLIDHMTQTATHEAMHEAQRLPLNEAFNDSIRAGNNLSPQQYTNWDEYGAITGQVGPTPSPNFYPGLTAQQATQALANMHPAIVRTGEPMDIALQLLKAYDVEEVKRRLMDGGSYKDYVDYQIADAQPGMNRTLPRPYGLMSHQALNRLQNGWFERDIQDMLDDPNFSFERDNEGNPIWSGHNLGWGNPEHADPEHMGFMIENQLEGTPVDFEEIRREANLRELENVPFELNEPQSASFLGMKLNPTSTTNFSTHSAHGPTDTLEEVEGMKGRGFQDIYTGEPMDIAFQLLKERVSPEAKRHKLEYDKKYESSPERVKYREELNRERRRRGIYGSHDHKDISHTEGGKLTLEGEHENRARHFKDKGTLREL